MSRDLFVNRYFTADVDRRLQALPADCDPDDVSVGIYAALGVGGPEALTEDRAPVLGYYFEQDGVILRMSVVTPGRFIRFEVDTTTKNSLIVAVPVSRIRRVVEEVRDGRVLITVELDADRQVLTLSGESVTGPAAGDALPEGARAGRWEASGTVGFTRYVVTADIPPYSEDDDNDTYKADVWDFGLALRNVLGR
jgi:hypothetical protein